MRRTSRAVRVAVAVLLLVLLGNAIVATYGLRSSSLAQRQSQIENLSLVLSEHASQTLYSANTALDSIVSLDNAARLQTEPQFRAFAARPEQFELLASKTRANQSSMWRRLSVPKARSSIFSRSYPPPDIDLSDRDYFRHFLRTRSPNTFFSVPVQNKGTGRWVFYLARSINNERAIFSGPRWSVCRPRYFQRFYARLGASLGPGSTLLLYRNDFTLMTRWPFVATQVGSRNMEGGVSIALDRAAGSGRAVFTSRPRMVDPGVSVERMICPAGGGISFRGWGRRHRNPL